jgi:hypothetical protein
MTILIGKIDENGLKMDDKPWDLGVACSQTHIILG